MLCRDLITHTFSAFSIERWNDHPRAGQLTEMDKQAHKAMIAWTLAHRCEASGMPIDWTVLIEGGLCEFFRRVTLTDLKPPVFHKLMADEGRRRQLDEWVWKHIDRPLNLLNRDFANRCKKWFEAPPQRERRLLEAAHYLASRFEFQFVEPLSHPFGDTRSIHDQLDEQVRVYADLPGVTDALTPTGKTAQFISLIGQLRFQKRWAQTPRLPQTSVLGHLLMVAQLAYYLSLEIGAGRTRRINNFYCGLWHDLPEVLTRDIISPVKRSVGGLEELIKELEIEAMEQDVYPLVSPTEADRLRYYTCDEFENRYRLQGLVRTVDGDLGPGHDDELYDAVDGRLIEACDKFAAFVEAGESIRLGIAPPALVEGHRNLLTKFKDRQPCGYPLCKLFDLYS